jgi:hypothetical protein
MLISTITIGTSGQFWRVCLHLSYAPKRGSGSDAGPPCNVILAKGHAPGVVGSGSTSEIRHAAQPLARNMTHSHGG